MSTRSEFSQQAAGPSAPAASGPDHFFEHHGLWAPGVRLFRRLQFGAKAGWISLTFLLPLLLLLAAYWRNSQATLEFARKELLGVAVIERIEPWLVEVQKQRRLVLSGLSAAPDLAAIEQPMNQVRAELDKTSAELDLRADLDRVMPLHDALRHGAQSDPEKPLLDYVEGLRQLRVTVMDRSQLTHDPDQDTHYLMALATDLVSNVVESVSRSRALAGSIETHSSADAAHLRQLYGVWFMGGERVAGILNAAHRAAEANPEVKRRVESQDAVDKTQAFLKASAAVWFDGPFQAQVKALDGPGQAAVESLRTVGRQSTTLLRELLQQRIEKTQHERHLLLGLKEVSRHLVAMTSGDLTTSPHPWGQDEAARLMAMLARMQDSLRHMVLQVRASSDEIVHTSTEIAEGAADLSARTEQTAANLEESAAAMEQISATVRQSAEHTQEATRIAGQNAQIAQRGGQVIGHMVTTMEEIQGSSRKIGDIIGVIDGIAFQTNILALNAAVEAARAGEQGRGFAVVASEVRTLAQRSAEAAREIKSLIVASVEKVESGTEVVREAGSTMQEIVASADRVNELLSYIATGSVEQSQGIGQVGEAVQELDRATQQNAALVEETAAGASALRDQAVELAQEVARFQVPEGLAAEARAELKATDLNVDSAIEAHRQWKVKLRAAIDQQTQLDAETLSCDDRCTLGQWIYGPGGQTFGNRPGFLALLEDHKSFHKAAGDVARRINSGSLDDAQRMLGAGSVFARASNAVIMRLTRIKRGL